MDVVCSWSGGKDSALALDLALEAGAVPRALLSMLVEGGERSRSHGLPRAVLAARAQALGIPLLTRAASWDDYTDAFTDALAGSAATGVAAGVFGDIDLEHHREWCRGVCRAAGLRAQHPLWGRPRRELLEQLLERGWSAAVVAVRAGALDPAVLGRRLDAGLVDELEAAGIDPSGEAGEYHTVVTGGPRFAAPLALRHGERVLRSGYWFLDVSPA